MNPVICVTEFTEQTRAAATAAFAMARRWGERMLLVRSVDEREQFPLRARQRLVEDDRPRLAREVAELQAAGIPCEGHVILGPPEESIASFARRADARLVVLGCGTLSRLDAWVLGCTGEQIAATTHVPLLLIRSATPFATWAAGEKPLRIYAFVDPRDHSPTIARALDEWRAIADERVEFHDAPLDAIHHPHEAARRCVADAAAADADLVVIGTHPRPALPLLHHTTLVDFLLREAPLSVLVVPDTCVAHPVETAPSREDSRGDSSVPQKASNVGRNS